VAESSGPDEGTRRDGAGPVTVTVSRTVKAGCEEAFEGWLSGVCAEASRFEGHLGASVLRPAAGSRPEYVLIFRFDSAAHLEAWNRSAARAEWLERALPLTAGEPRREIVTGLEHWFTLPGAPAVRPPPRHKMALVTWLAIFPLVLVIGTALEPLLSGTSRLVRTFVMTALLVLLMTYVVMPQMTRLFRRWLFPG
jgi:uncharacterized protein